MSFRRCHSTWKPKNLKQLLLWRNLGNEYQRSLGILHRTPLCGQLSLRDSRRFVQCQLCPDIRGYATSGIIWKKAWQTYGALWTEDTGNTDTKSYDFGTDPIVNVRMRAGAYDSTYGSSSSVSVAAAQALIIIKL